MYSRSPDQKCWLIPPCVSFFLSLNPLLFFVHSFQHVHFWGKFDTYYVANLMLQVSAKTLYCSVHFRKYSNSFFINFFSTYSLITFLFMSLIYAFSHVTHSCLHAFSHVNCTHFNSCHPNMFSCLSSTHAFIPVIHTCFQNSRPNML